MTTLHEVLADLRNTGGAGASLRKHLTAVGINKWEDFSTEALYDLRDHLKESVAPSTAKTIAANLKAILNRYGKAVDLPTGWEKALSVKSDDARGTFLTDAELLAFENVETLSDTERIVQVESLIEAYTGARISDAAAFTEDNFTADGQLTYTSKKTHTTATIPVSEKTKGWILYAQEHRADEPTLMSRNRIIRRLARRAGITERVKVRKGGRDVIAPKCDLLSSHAFRRSTATNLVLKGVTMEQAMVALGHRDMAMTRRYCVATRVNFSDKALAYFGV